VTLLLLGLLVLELLLHRLCNAALCGCLQARRPGHCPIACLTD
jgi:hypothetical protein